MEVLSEIGSIITVQKPFAEQINGWCFDVIVTLAGNGNVDVCLR